MELKVRTTDTKNSGLSERHFHVCMCEGPFSWDLNSFYPAVLLLSPCLTEADISLTFGVVASWCRSVGKKASLFSHVVSVISFTREGNFSQASRLFFTVCHLQWEETVWPGSLSLRRKTCTLSLESCLCTAGEYRLPASGPKSRPF